MSKMLRLTAVALLAPLLLGGCLEIDQYPAWIEGEYDNKYDNLPSQVHFHGDRLAWNAAITDRNHLQNEYNRTGIPRREGDSR